jgi:hypothetical protein
MPAAVQAQHAGPRRASCPRTSGGREMPRTLVTSGAGRGRRDRQGRQRPSPGAAAGPAPWPPAGRIQHRHLSLAATRPGFAAVRLTGPSFRASTHRSAAIPLARRWSGLPSKCGDFLILMFRSHPAAAWHAEIRCFDRAPTGRLAGWRGRARGTARARRARAPIRVGNRGDSAAVHAPNRPASTGGAARPAPPGPPVGRRGRCRGRGLRRRCAAARRMPRPGRRPSSGQDSDGHSEQVAGVGFALPPVLRLQQGRHRQRVRSRPRLAGELRDLHQQPFPQAGLAVHGGDRMQRYPGQRPPFGRATAHARIRHQLGGLLCHERLRLPLLRRSGPDRARPGPPGAVRSGRRLDAHAGGG